MFVILDLNNWSLENNVFFTKNNSTCYWAQVGHLAVYWTDKGFNVV